MNKILVTALAIASFAVSGVASASVLSKAKSTGVITVGFVEKAPFSSLAGEMPVGYSIDIASKIIDAVKEATGLPGLRVQWVSITAEDRLIMVQSGAISFECGTTPKTPENEALVGFSAPIVFAHIAPARHVAYGCTFPIRDREFQSLVNRSIVGDQASGEAAKLQKKWFSGSTAASAVFQPPSDRTF